MTNSFLPASTRPLYDFREAVSILGLSVERMMQLENTGLIPPPASIRKDLSRRYTFREIDNIARLLCRRSQRTRRFFSRGTALVFVVFVIFSWPGTARQTQKSTVTPSLSQEPATLAQADSPLPDEQQDSSYDLESDQQDNEDDFTFTASFGSEPPMSMLASLGSEAVSPMSHLDVKEHLQILRERRSERE